MNVEEVRTNLEAIYIDYFDGLYTEPQLKHMLKKLYTESKIPITAWSEMILDAQWKYANEEDYEKKRQQLAIDVAPEKD